MTIGSSLRTKMLAPHGPVVLYETVPPRAAPRWGGCATSPPGSRRGSAVCTSTRSTSLKSGTNPPEPGPAALSLPRDQTPREYARMLAALTGKEPIINQVVVHYDRESYVTWLRETWDEYGIRNLVLVGGDSSRTAYEGPSVLEAAHPGRS